VRFGCDYLTNTITLLKIPKDWFNRRMLFFLFYLVGRMEALLHNRFFLFLSIFFSAGHR